jgi:sugar phosphate isomerase/epimerase
MTLHDRRSFLAALGASLGAVACAASGVRGADSTRAAAAAAPDEHAAPAGNLGPIGVQLYTVRGEMKKDVAATLARVARIGYTEVEFAGYFDKSPREIRALLDANGLRAPSSHLQTPILGAQWPAALDAAKVIGHEYVVVPWFDRSKWRGLDDVKRLADQFDQAAADAKKAGLRFAYHNHDFEFAPLEGKVPYDLMLERMDAQAVKLEMDLYWTVKGGANPVAYFEKYPGRFQLLHVKDMDSTPRRYFADVGRGTIDFKSIFARSRQAGVRHYFVENDEPAGSPFESLRVSYEYLRQLEF